jgi:nicotinamide riboside kinase
LPAPISIASIIGPRSTGKSFLVNQIATEFNSLS